ncbi:sensor domain-containing diguanylate cyclase [Cohnella yongneupensis]|uniref:Diguanylate cyclase n=1 Tax=Cohnella yongneupensis TaxID=425006 RepID=A0ABW0QW15_9BACL
MHTIDISGQLFTSTMTVVIVGLMLFMSYRLQGSNRRQAFRSLLVSLVIILFYNLLQLAIAVNAAKPSAWIVFGGKLLQVYAFIVINFAIFELYHRRRPRTRLWLFGLLVVALVIGIADFMPDAPAEAAADLAVNVRTTPVLDGFMLLLSPLFALMFAPHIGQPRKYLASLFVSFASQLTIIVGAYGFAEPRGYGTLSGLLTVIYYCLLFLLLFERVVELLQSVYRSSITDGLTNLYNRRYFMGKLEQLVRSGRPHGVIFCDIDNFKRLNDTQGHHKADIVLKQVAAILTEETEGIGLAGRYGGEELVAIVAGPSSALMQTAEAIRARTEKESLVTVSVGVRLYEAGVTAEQLMKNADQAMYHSKTNGKNRVTDFAKLKGAS